MNAPNQANRPRLREDMVAVLNRWVEELRQDFGDELDAVVVYGSVLSNDFTPGRSDINTLVLLTRLDAEVLARAGKVYARWQRTLRTGPILLTRRELHRSADVFPIEYADMQARHVTLHGLDPLDDLEIAPADLRLQLEHELKSKLVRLREAYLQVAGRERAVAQLMAHSVGSFLTLAGAALRLRGESPPPDRKALLERLAAAFALETAPFAEVLALKSSPARKGRGAANDLFARYLKSVEALAQWVDEGLSLIYNTEGISGERLR
jgi:predicted nucleotidyltransferase